MDDFSIFLKADRVEVSVKPNSGKSRIVGYDEDKNCLKVEIKAPPENNKANIEVIKLFSRLTGKKVRIVSGLTSRKKVLQFI